MSRTDGPPMKIDAQFVASASALAQCPPWDRIEVAIAGRSNVGKSSLINALTGVKGLARTSKTPGRTRALNFFAMGDDLGAGRSAGLRLREDVARGGGADRPDDVGLSGAAAQSLPRSLILIDARRGPSARSRRWPA